MTMADEKVVIPTRVKVHICKWLLVILWIVHTYLLWHDYGIELEKASSAKTSSTKSPLFNAHEILKDAALSRPTHAQTAILSITLVLVACFLALTAIGLAGVCFESLCMVITVASLWSALFVFDLGSHLAANINFLQYHYIVDVILIALLWYMQRLISVKRAALRSEQEQD